MPNFSGKWNLQGQLQGIKQGDWTGILVEASELYSWGRADEGQLGDLSTVSKSSPIQVGTLTNWSQASTGRIHSSAVKTDGTLWMWGEAGLGILGNNTASGNASSPIQVGALTNWASVSAGNEHTAAVKTDGTLWSWGRNSEGQVGDGTATAKSSPVQVGSLTTWSSVACGSYHTLAITTGGELYGWGFNTDGQVGDNTIVSKSSPVQIGALTNWASVGELGGMRSFAIKTDGTMWCWGDSTNGSLGNNAGDFKLSSPVQIGALTTWSSFSAGDQHTLALKTDGTLWSWGNNGDGRLGTNTAPTINVSSPVQVGALTTWSKVSAGSGSKTSHAIKTDGTLWVWGEAESGQAGTGDTVNRSSPVQVGALTTWSEVSGGQNHTLSVLQANYRTGMS